MESFESFKRYEYYDDDDEYDANWKNNTRANVAPC
jgi:hypothetical protein